MNSHNLCTNLEPPFGFEDLLGLGMKFCLCVDPPPTHLEVSTERFNRAIRIQGHLRASKDTGGVENSEDEEYNPKIYIQSTWQPPLASYGTKTSLQAFTEELKKLCMRNHSTWNGWQNLLD